MLPRDCCDSMLPVCFIVQLKICCTFVLPQSFQHANFCADNDMKSSSFGACHTVSSSTPQIEHNALQFTRYKLDVMK